MNVIGLRAWANIVGLRALVNVMGLRAWVNVLVFAALSDRITCCFCRTRSRFLSAMLNTTLVFVSFATVLQ